MKILSLFFISNLLTSIAFSHGEEKLGPHNGYIRMPGTYHVELVPELEGNFIIYLLDLQNQNGTTENSSVDLKVKDSKEVITFKCMSMDDHFRCANIRKVTIHPDSKVVLKTKRAGIRNVSEAIYDLPLSLKLNHQDGRSVEH